MPLMTKTVIECAEFMRDEGRISERQLAEFKRKCRRDQIVAPIIFGVIAVAFLCFVRFFAEIN